MKCSFVHKHIAGLYSLIRRVWLIHTGPRYQLGSEALTSRSSIIVSQSQNAALVLTGLEETQSETQNEGMLKECWGKTNLIQPSFSLQALFVFECLLRNEEWWVLQVFKHSILFTSNPYTVPVMMSCHSMFVHVKNQQIGPI